MTRIAFRSTCAMVSAAAALLVAACHKAPPPAPAPTPAPAPAPDNSAAEARARAAAAALVDSIARAEAARTTTRRPARTPPAAPAKPPLPRPRARRSPPRSRASIIDKDALRADAQAALDAKIPVLKEQTALHIRIDGNADDRGSDEYNLALGQRRSATAKRYLEARGIDASRIEVVSFGKERPACKDENEGCWQQNRRDGFSVTSGAGAGGSSNR